jgi:membrane protein implicated in regulation of membrane protease activity
MLMGDIILWVIVSVAALAIDIITSSFFFGGFTIGGIFALLAQMMGYDFMTQLIVFIAVSALAIVLEFVWLRKKIKKSIPKTLKMEEEYIGRTLTAEEDIEYQGRLKVQGIYWTVENDGDRIEKGEKAEVIGIRGNKLIIKKL